MYKIIYLKLKVNSLSCVQKNILELSLSNFIFIDVFFSLSEKSAGNKYFKWKSKKVIREVIIYGASLAFKI